MARLEGSINLSDLALNPEVCQQRATSLQWHIALETMANRGWRGVKQYGRFFGLFWVYGLIEPDRARLLKSSYFWLRHVDDIADADKTLPNTYSTRQQYLESKKEMTEKFFLDHTSYPVYGDPEDILLVDYTLAAGKLGIDLKPETLAILDTIIFDEERARTKYIPTQQELDVYFQKLDFACVEGAMKIAGDSYQPEDLVDLSWATRTVFNLRDFPNDFAKGIVNISREDIERYGVDTAQISGRSSVQQLLSYHPMRQWYTDQVRIGQDFLNQAKEKLSVLDLRFVTRLALNINFIRPAQHRLTEYSRLLESV